jgi:hypothetical protein
MHRKAMVAALCIGLSACTDASKPADRGTPDRIPDLRVPDQAAPDLCAADRDRRDRPPIDRRVIDARPPQIVTHWHTGWRSPTCAAAGCHPVQIDEHTVTRAPECAVCHGANGACNPNGAYSGKQDHKQSDVCVACHNGSVHGYTQSADCVSCHLAAEGTLPTCP